MRARYIGDKFGRVCIYGLIGEGGVNRPATLYLIAAHNGNFVVNVNLYGVIPRFGIGSFRLKKFTR